MRSRHAGNGRPPGCRAGLLQKSRSAGRLLWSAAASFVIPPLPFALPLFRKVSSVERTARASAAPRAPFQPDIASVSCRTHQACRPRREVRPPVVFGHSGSFTPLFRGGSVRIAHPWRRSFSPIKKHLFQRAEPAPREKVSVRYKASRRRRVTSRCPSRFWRPSR